MAKRNKGEEGKSNCPGLDKEGRGRPAVMGWLGSAGDCRQPWVRQGRALEGRRTLLEKEDKGKACGHMLHEEVGNLGHYKGEQGKAGGHG